MEGKTDNLNGLKENLIMGNLIPAGTAMRMYRGLKVKDLATDAVSVEKPESPEDFIELGENL